MKRHRTHQIDELAQRIFKNALPPTWVVNKQENDYAKDFHVEIGEDNSDLTGSSFFVQLKGQEKADISADGSLVKYCLEIKYAAYYLDKIKDLPVFLVVVDVNSKKGWWLFLQPVLDANQAWRKKGGQNAKKKPCVTVSLPISNDISDTASLRMAVEEAKKWMRLYHPASIHEAIVAHKERITRTDPRFDVRTSVVNDRPSFTLLAKQDVSIKMTFSGTPGEINKKVSDLLDKGALVEFSPGELTISGSPLFEQMERTGVTMKVGIDLPIKMSLTCRNAEGKELAKLSDLTGTITGGRLELFCEAGLAGSLFSVTMGPIRSDNLGSMKVKVKINLNQWENQRLHHLSYFDYLQRFFAALSGSTATTIECEHNGNIVFSATAPLQSVPFVAPTAYLLETLRQARRVAERLNLNPIWTVNKFDWDSEQAIKELYGVFFENAWLASIPGLRIVWKAQKAQTFGSDGSRTKGRFVRVTSNWSYSFLGERFVPIERIVRETTEMNLAFRKTRRKVNGPKGQRGNVRKQLSRTSLECILTGSPKSMMRVRLASRA